MDFDPDDMPPTTSEPQDFIVKLFFFGGISRKKRIDSQTTMLLATNVCQSLYGQEKEKLDMADYKTP